MAIGGSGGAAIGAGPPGWTTVKVRPVRHRWPLESRCLSIKPSYRLLLPTSSALELQGFKLQRHTRSANPHGHTSIHSGFDPKRGLVLCPDFLAAFVRCRRGRGPSDHALLSRAGRSELNRAVLHSSLRVHSVSAELSCRQTSRGPTVAFHITVLVLGATSSRSCTLVPRLKT